MCPAPVSGVLGPQGEQLDLRLFTVLEQRGVRGLKTEAGVLNFVRLTARGRPEPGPDTRLSEGSPYGPQPISPRLQQCLSSKQ